MECLSSCTQQKLVSSSRTTKRRFRNLGEDQIVSALYGLNKSTENKNYSSRQRTLRQVSMQLQKEQKVDFSTAQEKTLQCEMLSSSLSSSFFKFVFNNPTDSMNVLPVSIRSYGLLMKTSGTRYISDKPDKCFLGILKLRD